MDRHPAAPPFVVVPYLTRVERHFHEFFLGPLPMARAGRSCSVPLCPHLKPCPVPGHERRAWEGSTRRARLPHDWSHTIVPRILARDPVCRVCAKQRSTQVDHIVAGDDHRDENLQGICADCHRAKTQREAAEARARMSS